MIAVIIRADQPVAELFDHNWGSSVHVALLFIVRAAFRYCVFRGNQDKGSAGRHQNDCRGYSNGSETSL